MRLTEKRISVPLDVKLFSVAPKNFEALPLVFRDHTAQQQQADVIESNVVIYFLCAGNKIRRIGLTGNLRNRLAQYKTKGFQQPSGEIIEFDVIDSVFYAKIKSADFPKALRYESFMICNFVPIFNFLHGEQATDAELKSVCPFRLFKLGGFGKNVSMREAIEIQFAVYLWDETDPQRKQPLRPRSGAASPVFDIFRGNGV